MPRLCKRCSPTPRISPTPDKKVFGSAVVSLAGLKVVWKKKKARIFRQKAPQKNPKMIMQVNHFRRSFFRRSFFRRSFFRFVFFSHVSVFRGAPAPVLAPPFFFFLRPFGLPTLFFARSVIWGVSGLGWGGVGYFEHHVGRN